MAGEGNAASSARLDLGEFGSTGLNRFSGFVNEEFLRELRGRQGIKVFREMSENDPTIGGLLFAIKMLIRQVTWDVEPFSEDPNDVANAEFIKTCLEDMEQPWSATINELLSMLPFGWCLTEMVYKTRIGPDEEAPEYRSKYSDGLVGWRKMPIRAQETLWQWDFAENGDLLGMFQVAPPDYKNRYIPMWKALLFRTESTKGNPEGRSILRNAYRPWYFKKHVENIEAIGIERDLAGLPIAWVPPDLMEPDAPLERKQILAQIQKIVTNIKRDEQEGLVFPLMYDDQGNKIYDLTLLSTGGRRQFDTSEIINRYDQRILMTSLADFMMLGHTKVGTFSLSSSKTELFATAVGAWMDSICDEINRTELTRLFRYNGKPVDRLPKLTHGDIESQDLEVIGKYLADLTSAGAAIFPNPELENYLLKQAGMPTVQHENPAPAQVAPVLDPSAAPVDPSAAPVDPNATPVDPNAPTIDPNAPDPSNPDPAAALDPNAPPDPLAAPIIDNPNP